MKEARTLVVLAMLLGLSACGGGESNGSGIEIPDRPLSGTIAGEPWEMLSGQAEPAHDRTDALSATFMPEAIAACEPQLSMPYAYALVPLTPGEYDVSIDLPAAFVSQGEDSATTISITFTGRISVESVDDSKVVGGIALVLDDKPGFSIGGKFTLDRCP